MYLYSRSYSSIIYVSYSNKAYFFPDKPRNVSKSSVECESNSKIQLRCSDLHLPDSFEFDGWIHHFNGVLLRHVVGLSTQKGSSIDIPFCTYEDIGNYTCTVTDKRHNNTVFNSTTYLYVPGMYIFRLYYPTEVY